MSDQASDRGDDGRDTSRASSVRKKTRGVRVREEQFARDLDVVLTSTEGRRMLWCLLEDAGIFADPFTGDEATTAYRCGRQAWGRKVFTYLMTPSRQKIYAEMVEESSK